MLGFFRAASKKEGVLALDLGSESVKAGLFRIEQKLNQRGESLGQRAMIASVGEAPLPSSGESLLANHLAQVIRKSKEALAIASKKAGFLPSQIILGIGGEHVSGSTCVLEFDREDPDSKINLSELRNIIHKLEWAAFDETRRKVSQESGYAEIDLKLVHASVIEISIDGYKARNPLGFQGKKVKLSLFNAFVPLGHHSALEKIASEFDAELMGMICVPYALSQMGKEEKQSLSSIFIDIGGSSTQIGISQNGALMEMGTFALGGNAFTKRIAMELNISLKEAEELKKAYSEDRLEQRSKQILSDVLRADAELWLEGVLLSLSRNKKVNPLPSSVCLSGGGSFLPEIQEVLSQRKWHKQLPFADSPQIHLFRPQALHYFADEKKLFQDQRNATLLALVKVAMELEEKESIAEKTLKKVIGIMKV